MEDKQKGNPPDAQKKGNIPPWTTMQPGISGGEQGSEHTLGDAGMAQSTTEGTAQVDKERAAQGSLENLRAERLKRGEDPDAPVTRASTTSWTEADQRIYGDARGSGKDRTPQEMSHHEELSTEPIKKKREGHVAEDTGRGGA